MNNGRISSYAIDMDMGVIDTHDEKRLIFSKMDWLSIEIPPVAGLIVTFEMTGPVAKRIRVIDRSSLT